MVGSHVFGPLNTYLLKECLDALVQRHESLRTRFVVVDGVPRQQIDERGECPLGRVELAASPRCAADGEIDLIAQQFYEEKVDLSVGPLFAAKLIRLSAREHVLILALDHMIGDSVSEEIVRRETWALYDQRIQGLPFSLPRLPVQFADYAIWQQQTYGAWLEKHGGYWKGRLTDAPHTKIPVDNELTDAEELASELIQFSFGKDVSARLRNLARREGTLLSLVVLTIYIAVMSRWCRQNDLMLAFVSSGRNRHELQNMVGFVVNILWLRIRIDDNDRFLDLVNRVTLEFDAAVNHQDFDRVPDLIPVQTQLGFNWLSDRQARWSADYQVGTGCGIRIQAIPLRVALRGNFSPIFYDTAVGINVEVHYRPEIVAPSTVERFGGDLRLFAEEFTQRPFARVGSVPI